MVTFTGPNIVMESNFEGYLFPFKLILASRKGIISVVGLAEHPSGEIIYLELSHVGGGYRRNH